MDVSRQKPFWCGHRCHWWNLAVGGGRATVHLEGCLVALDILEVHDGQFDVAVRMYKINKGVDAGRAVSHRSCSKIEQQVLVNSVLVGKDSRKLYLGILRYGSWLRSLESHD